MVKCWEKPNVKLDFAFDLTFIGVTSIIDLQIQQLFLKIIISNKNITWCVNFHIKMITTIKSKVAEAGGSLFSCNI